MTKVADLIDVDAGAAGEEEAAGLAHRPQHTVRRAQHLLNGTSSVSFRRKKEEGERTQTSVSSWGLWTGVRVKEEVFGPFWSGRL